ncbi:MAG: hypothetical protein A2284_10015, partial [Deltaproteobacteria bacterium RIFOXYA12_FULL_61_11]
AVTRGDGTKGEPILEQVRHIAAIPQSLPERNLELRGELYLPLGEFERYRDRFQSPRNLAAGAVKQKDPSRTAEFGLRFFVYDVLGRTFERERDKFELARRLGFPDLDYSVVRGGEALAVFQDFQRRRYDQPYELDGVVFKVDQVAAQEVLGGTAHHPRYALAYKFASRETETIVREVQWGVGRSRVITPVALVEPVLLSGATIRRVTLHNVGQLRRLGVTLGCTVKITRRGDVIPYISEVTAPGDTPVEIPLRCPSCGAPTEERTEGRLLGAADNREDASLYCSGTTSCSSAARAFLEHYLKAVGCEGFGERLIERLYEFGLVRTPVELYALTVEDLLPLERMGETLAAKLVEHIAATRHQRLATFLEALGLPGVGRRMAEQLEAEFGTLEALRTADRESLVRLPGIGERVADALLEGLRDKGEAITALLREIVLSPPPPKTRGALEGLGFLFTGTLESMDRRDAEALVLAAGGRVLSGVSKDLDYLVVGRSERVSGKLRKAEKLRAEGGKVELVEESRWLRLLEERGVAVK